MAHSVEPAQVRRGDLVVAVQRSRTAFVGKSSEETVRVTLGVATSVSRDGRVHKWATPMFSSQDDPSPKRFDTSEWTWVPKEKVSISEVLKQYRSHVWEHSDSEMVRPYDSFDEVKSVLRECRTPSA